MTGLDAQDFGRRRPCSLELAQSRVGRSQHNMPAVLRFRRPGDTLQHRLQSLDPCRQQKRSKQLPTSSQASFTRAVTGSGRVVLAFVMALLSSRGISPSSLPGQGEQRRLILFQQTRGIPLVLMDHS